MIPKLNHKAARIADVHGPAIGCCNYQYQVLTFVYQYCSSYHQMHQTANTKKPGQQNKLAFIILKLFFSDPRSCNEFKKMANQKLVDGEYPLRIGNETLKVSKINKNLAPTSGVYIFKYEILKHEFQQFLVVWGTVRYVFVRSSLLSQFLSLLEPGIQAFATRPSAMILYTVLSFELPFVEGPQ